MKTCTAIISCTGARTFGLYGARAKRIPPGSLAQRDDRAGRLGEITKDKVVLASAPTSKEFPVNEIKYVQIPTEPKELMEARNAAFEGRFADVINALDRIPPPALGNEAVKQDADFYRALAGARLAHFGQRRRSCRRQCAREFH